jgi:hypothetical protein
MIIGIFIALGFLISSSYNAPDISNKTTKELYDSKIKEIPERANK